MLEGGYRDADECGACLLIRDYEEKSVNKNLL